MHFENVKKKMEKVSMSGMVYGLLISIIYRRFFVGKKSLHGISPGEQTTTKVNT